MAIELLAARTGWVAPVQRTGDRDPGAARRREAARRAAAMNKDSRSFAEVMASAMADHS
jgi:hypothetical protein